MLFLAHSSSIAFSVEPPHVAWHGNRRSRTPSITPMHALRLSFCSTERLCRSPPPITPSHYPTNCLPNRIRIHTNYQLVGKAMGSVSATPVPHLHTHKQGRAARAKQGVAADALLTVICRCRCRCECMCGLVMVGGRVIPAMPKDGLWNGDINQCSRPPPLLVFFPPFTYPPILTLRSFLQQRIETDLDRSLSLLVRYILPAFAFHIHTRTHKIGRNSLRFVPLALVGGWMGPVD